METSVTVALGGGELKGDTGKAGNYERGHRGLAQRCHSVGAQL